jgi:hypothetical protein
MTHHGKPEEHDDNQVHTSPEEGHPAGDGERSDRDIGGPTSGEESGEDVTGGAKGTRESEFDSH